MCERYDPERSLAELRAARDCGYGPHREMARIMAKAAHQAQVELWPHPRDREVAGLGAVVAAASLAAVAQPGVDAPLLSAVGFFGLALVESARAEVRDV